MERVAVLHMVICMLLLKFFETEVLAMNCPTDCKCLIEINGMLQSNTGRYSHISDKTNGV